MGRLWADQDTWHPRRRKKGKDKKRRGEIKAPIQWEMESDKKAAGVGGCGGRNATNRY